MTESAPAPPVVALLGTGIMGAGMGRNLARAGLPVRVWNRTRDRAESLAADGATVTDSPAEAVRAAEVIVTMLADGPTVSEVLAAAADGLAPGQIWVQASTVSIDWIGRLAAQARDRGLVFLDVPVLGTRAAAEAGQLTVLAAGPDTDRDRVRARVRPVLDAIGQKTVWLNKPGAGTRLKLVTNSWVQALTVAAGETVALAQGLGVDPRAFLAAVAGGPADSGVLQAKAGAILSGDYSTDASVNAVAEVATLIAEAGEAEGLRMDVARAIVARLRRATIQGHGGQDAAAAYYASFGGRE
jgi:3-hydroxyisobutyrate dehydrogenase